MSKDIVINLILQYAQPEAEAGQFGAVATKLNAKSIQKRHTAPVNYNRIRKALGDSIRRQIADGLRAHADGDVRDAHQKMLDDVGGVDMSLDERQNMIQLVGTSLGWGEETITTIKEMGITHRSPVQTVGLPDVTEQDCQDAWVQHMFQQQWAALREAELDAAIFQGRAATIAALRSIADQLEA